MPGSMPGAPPPPPPPFAAAAELLPAAAVTASDAAAAGLLPPEQAEAMSQKVRSIVSRAMRGARAVHARCMCGARPAARALQAYVPRLQPHT